MSIKVKVCGVKSIEHVRSCIKGKAKMIGLMFYKKSPRYINIDKAKKISNFAKKKIFRVGVFANMEIEDLKKIIGHVDLDYLQFHGNEKIKFLEEVKKKFKIKIIKALKISKNEDIKKINNFQKISDYILIDTKIINKENFNFKKKSKKMNWNVLKKIKDKKKLILSGAINEKNLQIAIKNTDFNFVDISSGLESTPGKKSVKKINKFLELAIKL